VNDTRSPPPDKSLTRIFVTGDSEQYYTVDITGFRDAAFIKELIFSKVWIQQHRPIQLWADLFFSFGSRMRNNRDTLSTVQKSAPMLSVMPYLMSNSTNSVVITEMLRALSSS
jgi:hypothetical protein